MTWNESNVSSSFMTMTVTFYVIMKGWVNSDWVISDIGVLSTHPVYESQQSLDWEYSKTASPGVDGAMLDSFCTGMPVHPFVSSVCIL